MEADVAPSAWKREPLPRYSGEVALLKDMSTGKVLLVSHHPADNSGPEAWVGFEPVISSNGRFIAFIGTIGKGVRFTGALYLRDRVSGAITREDVTAGGTPGSAGASWPSISGDGRFIAFCSTRSLGVGGVGGVFLKDTKTGELTNLAHYCEPPKITPDGRYVVFGNRSNILVRYDRITRKLLRLGPVGALSATGRYFAGSDKGGGNAYVEDLVSGSRSSIPLAGRIPPALYPSAAPMAISASGHRVVLQTAGTPDGRYFSHLIAVNR
jgi:Tol biopolymer transport system component